MVRGKKKAAPRRSARATKKNVATGNLPVVGGKKKTQPVKTMAKNAVNMHWKKMLPRGAKAKRRWTKWFQSMRLTNRSLICKIRG